MNFFLDHKTGALFEPSFDSARSFGYDPCGERHDYQAQQDANHALFREVCRWLEAHVEPTTTLMMLAGSKIDGASFVAVVVSVPDDLAVHFKLRFG